MKNVPNISLKNGLKGGSGIMEYQRLLAGSKPICRLNISIGSGNYQGYFTMNIVMK